MEEIKLRTLKDFQDFSKRQTGNRMLEILKQEAIKWVTYIRKKADEPEMMLNRDRYMSVQGWILKFFNITEEELKDG